MTMTKKWQDHWKGMPEYKQEKTEFHCIKVSFGTKEAMQRFAEWCGQTVTLQSKIIYVPEKKSESSKGKTYIDESDFI